jgi:hypothetical protein
MGELERRIRAQQTAGAGVQQRIAEWQAQSRRNSMEFIDQMRAHRVGTTALYDVVTRPIMRETLFGNTVDTGREKYAFDLVGRGWLIAEGCDEYRMPTNLIVLENNTTVRCNPPTGDKTCTNEPSVPFVFVQEGGLEECTMQYPFYDEGGVDRLASAAMRLIQQQ